MRSWPKQIEPREKSSSRQKSNILQSPFKIILLHQIHLPYEIERPCCDQKALD